MLKLETEREDDGRWIAEVRDLPGVLAYGDTQGEAIARAEALALRVLADRLEHGEAIPELKDLFVAWRSWPAARGCASVVGAVTDWMAN